MTAFITSEDELRSLIPKPAKAIESKRLRMLEEHSSRFVSLASFCVFATRRADGPMDITLRVGGDQPVKQIDERTLIVSDDPRHGVGVLGKNVESNPGIGALISIPGVRETLRVNGRGRLATVAERTAAFEDPPTAAIVIELDEHYLHCAKAFIRSKLWEKPAPTPEQFAPSATSKLSSEETDFLKRSPFALLATCSANGEADLSPRGDPAGFVQTLPDGAVLIPERPGNRLVDSLRNIIRQPAATIMCLVPGDARILQLRGRAQLLTDKELLAPSAIRGKPPVVGIHLQIQESELNQVAAFVDSGFWSPTSHIDRNTLPTFGRMLIDQLNPKGRMKALKAAGLEAVLKLDERNGLY